MKKLLCAIGLLIATPATAAEKWVSCHVDQVMHTRLGILVNCAEKFPDVSGAGPTDTVEWFAADASGAPSPNGIAPALTRGEMMAGFEAIALEAFRSQKVLRVAFNEGSRPGSLYDCLNTNCRLARAWAIVR